MYEWLLLCSLSAIYLSISRCIALLCDGKSVVRLSVTLVHPDSIVLNFLKLLHKKLTIESRYRVSKKDRSAAGKSSRNSRWNKFGVGITRGIALVPCDNTAFLSDFF